MPLIGWYPLRNQLASPFLFQTLSFYPFSHPLLPFPFQSIHSNTTNLRLPMPPPPLARLALPAVITLVAFLAYGSQVLFSTLEPYDSSKRQSVIFNLLVACVWVTYLRACLTDPGSVVDVDIDRDSSIKEGKGRERWCGKCQARKPPRAHHCKICQR